jgi:hypothetical protein
MPYSGKAPSQWHFLETSCCRNLFSVSIRKTLAVLVEPVEVLPEVSSRHCGWGVAAADGVAGLGPRHRCLSVPWDCGIGTTVLEMTLRHCASQR